MALTYDTSKFTNPNYSAPSAYAGLGQQGVQAIGQLGQAAAPSLMDSMNPYLAAGSALAGTGLNIYQAFKNQDNADKAYQLQLQQFNEQLKNDRTARQQTDKQQGISDLYTNANNADQVQNDLLSKYAAYNKMIGK